MQYSNYKTDYGAPIPMVPSTEVQQTQPQSQYGQQTQPQSQYGQLIQPQSQYGQPAPGQPIPIPGQPLNLAIQPVMYITQEHFRPYETKCPHCHSQITTETSFVMGQIANMCVITLLCSFIWVGLFCFAFIPCCSDSMKDVQHICPRCRKVVAEYKRHMIAPQHQSMWFRPKGYHLTAANWYGMYGQNQPIPEGPPGVLIVQPKPPITDQNFRPYLTTCPHCRAQITTETSYHLGSYAWYWIFILTCIFAWFGFVCFICIPCCMNRCKDCTHTCPQCHKTVAEYARHEMI